MRRAAWALALKVAVLLVVSAALVLAVVRGHVVLVLILVAVLLVLLGAFFPLTYYRARGLDPELEDLLREASQEKAEGRHSGESETLGQRKDPEALPPPDSQAAGPDDDAHERDSGPVFSPSEFDRPVPGYAGPPAPRHPARYANVVLLGSREGGPVLAEPQAPVFIEIDIGALRRDSAVEDPLAGPFPDHLLPDRDIWLDVLLSSAELALGAGTEPDPGHEHTVELPLLLPARSKKAPAGSGSLRFWLRTPYKFEPGGARARLSYLYRDTVVQSQRLDLFEFPPDSEGEGGPRGVALRAVTDFTLSERLGTDLETIPERRRVSVLANSNSPAQHELTIRSPSPDQGQAGASAFTLNHDAVSRLVDQLREELSARAAPTRRRSARDLRRDLRELAPLGWQIYRELDFDGRRRIADAEPDAVIGVTMPQDSGFTLPWNFVYEIPFDVDPAELPFCPVVEELAAGTAALDPTTRRCPHDDGRSHAENLLCPFGFWGYRHSFELLVSTKSPKSQITLGPSPRVVVAQTQTGVKTDELAEHVERLEACFAGHHPAFELAEAKSRAEVKAALREDLPFVYFLCHGSRTRSGATRLGVGDHETIEPGDIDAWVETARRRAEREIWTDPQPLVFINACESLAIEPDDLRGYLAVFVEVAQAVGVIGTEAKVSQTLAMEVGEIFFERLLAPGASVDEALCEVKLSLLGSANLTGLLYTPYCFADLRVGTAVA